MRVSITKKRKVCDNKIQPPSPSNFLIEKFDDFKISKFKPIVSPDNKWQNPSLLMPLIKDKLAQTINIETEFFFIVHYYFTGNPVYCKHWNYQNKLEDCFDNLSMKDAMFNTHYDLLGISFMYPDIINLKRNENNEDLDDIVYKLNDKISFLLRKGNDNIMSSYKFITHSCKQKNIYKKCIDPDKAWAMHLLLNEKNMKFEDKDVLSIKFKEELITLPRRVLYNCLFQYYSQNI